MQTTPSAARAQFAKSSSIGKSQAHSTNSSLYPGGVKVLTITAKHRDPGVNKTRKYSPHILVQPEEDIFSNIFEPNTRLGWKIDNLYQTTVDKLSPKISEREKKAYDILIGKDNGSVHKSLESISILILSHINTNERKKVLVDAMRKHITTNQITSRLPVTTVNLIIDKLAGKDGVKGVFDFIMPIINTSIKGWITTRKLPPPKDEALCTQFKGFNPGAIRREIRSIILHVMTLLTLFRYINEDVSENAVFGKYFSKRPVVYVLAA
jgi:hypothetical protein